jgi:hypothetical protein
MINSLVMSWMEETHQKLPQTSTFYYDVATLFSSKSTLRSINLSTDYGDRWWSIDKEKSLKPVSSDFKTTGEMVKEYTLNWKGAFLKIEKGIGTSEEV